MTLYPFVTGLMLVKFSLPAPCTPANVGHNYFCENSTAIISWEETGHSESFYVHAQSGNHTVSCNHTDTFCSLPPLLCGRWYDVEVTAMADRCNSGVPGVMQIQTGKSKKEECTAPCAPVNVSASLVCEDNTGEVSWEPRPGIASYSVLAKGKDGDVKECTSNGSSCQLPNMHCSTTYTITVTPYSNSCKGEESSTYTYVSDGDEVRETLPVSEENDLEYRRVISNFIIWCELSHLHISSSKTKEMVVDFRRKPSTTAPVNIHGLDIEVVDSYKFLGVLLNYKLDWSDNSQAPYKKGQIVCWCGGSMERDRKCLNRLVKRASSALAGPLDSTEVVGERRMLAKLMSVMDNTSHPPHESVKALSSSFSSGLLQPLCSCPPTNIHVSLQCKYNVGYVTWDHAQQADLYVASTHPSAAMDEHVYNCSSSGTSCSLTDLHCGKTLVVTVVTIERGCRSKYSEPFTFQSVICPPTGLTGVTTCSNNDITVSWDPSPKNGVDYLIYSKEDSGATANYSTTQTSYVITGRQCSEKYTLAVAAKDFECTSVPSQPIESETAPCLPDRVQALPDCDANSFAVQWGASTGYNGIYMAMAIPFGRDHTTETCSTTDTNCVIPNLQCGVLYSIVVTTPEIDCSVIEGSNYKMQSAPCKPDSVSVDLQCSTNVATITWGNSGPDQTQVVTAVDSSGLSIVCNSSSSNCTFDQLKCGETYSVSVVGHSDTCSSDPAFSSQFKTAPCVPASLQETVDCDTGIILVSWENALGATSYTVYAQGSLGYNAEHNRTDTFCEFPDLACGQDYSITVVAHHDTCFSLVSETITAIAVPCPLSDLEATLNCDTNMAMVSWTPGSGILNYNALVSNFGFDTVDQHTCSTNGSSCNITSLLCGESYRVTVSGQGQSCPSPEQDWVSVNTVPCPPTQVMVNSSCTSNNIQVSWQASKGSDSYIAVAENDQGFQWSCSTTSTSCQISGLPCGQEYKVYVSGIDDKCTGTKSSIKMVRMAPCVPEDVQIDLNCQSSVVNITWQSTGHFLMFHASVVGSNGHINMCTTSKHHCVVRNMQCGMMYNVTVVAQDEICNSSHSPIKQLYTAPCPLSTFVPAVDCNTGVVSVTWSDSVPGVVYSVSAVDATGHRSNCSGTDSGCNLSPLRCGTQYDITITPSRDACVVPCVPHLLEVEMDCLFNSVWLKYNESAGAEGYIAEVADSQGDIQEFQCTVMSDGACFLPTLLCSQNLTFTLKAKDQQCESAPSSSVPAETAPCPPDNLQESVDCNNGTITIAWSAVAGAITYTAKLEDVNRDPVTCCITSNTRCNITDLPCGEMYSVRVTAEGRSCNSSPSHELIIWTVPCVPENLEASLSCSNNVASMSWTYIKDRKNYTVKAVDSSGHEDECNSIDTQCDLQNLLCGKEYTATVTAEYETCKSKPSESVTIRTVPCTPASISSVMDCQSNSLVVSWSESAGADSYFAMLRDSNGQSTTCQATTENYCSVTEVGCGQVYHVSVISSDGFCNSPPTDEVETPSVPCKVTYIRPMMDCNTWPAVLTWYPSDGAFSYMVVATTVLGHNVSCDTNHTNCELDGLQCGENYSVSVKAVGDSCHSLTYMMGQLHTEPCIPDHISTHYSPSVGQVQWDMTAGAATYTVTGQTDQGLQTSCATNNTNCSLPDMECGQVYSIKVTAMNHVCDDISSTELVNITTEPCPPNNVQAYADCQTNQGTVSWEESFSAVGYMAQFAGHDGHLLSCYTNETFCSMDGLHCGVIYHISVIAIGRTVNGSNSDTVMLAAAPCLAANITADLECSDDTAKVSWSPTQGAYSYKVMAQSANGYRASCETSFHECYLPNLLCGQVYTITLTTNNDHCQTETHSHVAISTRPCKPVHVGVDLQCEASTANMFWQEMAGVELYMATATYSMGMTLQCNSTNSTCQFSELDCGKMYTFSVTAYSNMCYSEVSSSVEMRTGPCQPTGLMVNGSCSSETVALQWSEARGASAYVMTAVSDLGYSTSLQTFATTIQTDLPCGQMFTFTVVAQGDRCDSAASLSEEFQTAPCTPEDVQSFTHCEDSLGAVSWAMSDGAESYMAIAMGQDGHVHTCTTNTTTCIWHDLHCGEQYTVEVVAMDYACNSRESNSTTIIMAPCIPQNLMSSLNCSTKVAVLSWVPSETAKYYIVTAETNSGHIVGLSTNETWTAVSDLLCGQEYFLSVQAADSVCTSGHSLPLSLQSVPCPPTGISSFMNCIPSIAVVSWTGSAGAEFYTATVTLDDGQSSSCSSDGVQCSMPNVLCGQTYTVTVVASNMKCDSDPSEPDTLQSVPCVPTDVEVNLNCANGHAVVSWSASTGALSYNVVAQDEQGAMIFCETSDLMCTLTNLTCGKRYNVQVDAEDDTCSSLPSSRVEFNSVPCTPIIGSVILDCFAKSAILDWLYAEGALYYTAFARTASNHISTCQSSFTNCELRELQCGQTYNVFTVASNGACSSPPSTTLQVESVPCPPENVVPQLDCLSNTAVVEWQLSGGADSYIVQAFSTQGHITGCETDSHSCLLLHLLCGFTYNITVTAVNSVCNVSQSDVTQLRAVPCVPQMVEARVVCESGAVAVSWEHSKGASSYAAVAQGSGGYTSTCNSSETTCLFSDLLCSLNYSVTVTASDERCSSAGSSVVEISTVPCVPQNVMAVMACSSDTGIVLWEEEDGVSSYKVQAFGPDGHRPECSTMLTSCKLPSMHCGQLYNLTVTAQDGRCDNSHVYLNLQSVPCRPTFVKASLFCHSNSAAVTWERASGALSYVAVGVTADGSHRATCNNTMTYCDLTELQCGEMYNVSVFTEDESCSSMESDKAYVQTVPCPPQNVIVDSECDNGAMVVSWSPNPDAQYFHVAAVSNTRARVYCNSSGNSCTLGNLPCGQNYNITVLSVRDSCESKPSTVVEVYSAPCLPRNIEGHLDCVSNGVWVRWDNSDGAASYFVMAQAANGHNSSCTSSSSHCKVHDLECGTVYTFQVTAINKDCRNNGNTTTFELETGPCALNSISVMTECNSDTILVKWEETPGTPVYVVTAEADDDSLIICNSSSTSCELENIRCGTHYSIIVSTSSDKCSSLRSSPKKIQTAPCSPENVTAVPSCEKNGASVTWAKSDVALSYYLLAIAQDGHTATCNKTVNMCSLGDLHCGQTYIFSIIAYGENCSSHPSISSFKTVPCAPSDLTVDFDCETNSASMSWSASEGAVQYFSYAQSMGGETLHCENTGPSCSFEGLECGEIYNFSVTASNGICNTSLSTPVQQGAAPCPPANVTFHMEWSEQRSWTMISWGKASCPDVEYMAEVTGRIKDNPHTQMMVTSYWLLRPYFEFPIPCSTVFNVTVRSRNSGGVSGPSSAVPGMTAPCPPQNVLYSGNMQSAEVSWDPSVLATSYNVYNVSGESHVLLCNTTELYCQLTNVDPDNIEVTASNDIGESNPNQNITGPV
ncbi:uncharacterized protein fndc7b [Pholidichthys leucotaenia]